MDKYLVKSYTAGSMILALTKFQEVDLIFLYTENIYYLYREYLLRSSNSDISNNLTTNWSHDTGKTVNDCIIYNGYKYSYDEILLALSKNK